MPEHNYVYKILPNTSPFQGIANPVPASEIIPRTQVDLDDGFIHLSTSTQLPNTLSRFFASDDTVQLLKIDYKRLSSFKTVKWEKASNGDTFPHLYGQLEGEFVRELKLVAKGGGWDDTCKALEEEHFIED